MKIINNQNTLKGNQRNNSWLLVARRSFGYWLFLLLLFAFSCSESTSSGGGNPGGGDNDYSARVEGVVADRKLALNYADGFIYGTVKPVRNGVEVPNASFAIVNSTAPNDEIAINPTTGEIRVARGLVQGEYTFTVQVTIPSTEGGSPEIRNIDETLTIAPKSITANDFSVSSTRPSAEFGYARFTYGKVTLNNEVMADFTLINVNPQNDRITLEENGDITVAPGLAAGTYTFGVQVSGNRNYEGIETSEELTLIIRKFSLKYVDNIIQLLLL